MQYKIYKTMRIPTTHCVWSIESFALTTFSAKSLCGKVRADKIHVNFEAILVFSFFSMAVRLWSSSSSFYSQIVLCHFLQALCWHFKVIVKLFRSAQNIFDDHRKKSPGIIYYLRLLSFSSSHCFVWRWIEVTFEEWRRLFFSSSPNSSNRVLSKWRKKQ